MQLRDENRLTVPSEVYGQLTWFDKSAAVELLAQLVRPGYIRLRPKHLLEEKLKTVDERLEQDAAQERRSAAAAKAAIADRYRPITLYKEASFTLPKAMLVFLGVTPPEKPFLYLRAVDDCIEILALSERNKLQIQTGESLDM